MKQIKLINLEDVTEEEAKVFIVRQAARTVVFDADGAVALLHATKNGYYKLPGGGIEKWETNEQALQKVKSSNLSAVYEASYMVTRDTAFLEFAIKLQK